QTPDGSMPKGRDKLEFTGIEFSKATKRITLSHVRVYDEARRQEENSARSEKRASADATKSSMKKINASVEKTTLGDISGLAELKAQLEAQAAPAKVEKAEKAEKAAAVEALSASKEQVATEEAPADTEEKSQE
ncbi:MAG: hypothetical protein LIO77_08785, partial [Rikenellaceae bacterium]|nr:hypothetical protein [Rikenellaceae bacterium]